MDLRTESPLMMTDAPHMGFKSSSKTYPLNDASIIEKKNVFVTAFGYGKADRSLAIHSLACSLLAKKHWTGLIPHSPSDREDY